MKKLVILMSFIVVSIVSFGQVETINNGESGLSVRTKLNTMFSQLYDLNLTGQFSTDNATWHDDFVIGDSYIRVSSDLGTTWSDGFLFFDGINIIDSLNMNNNRITNLADPTDVQDAVTLSYLQSQSLFDSTDYNVNNNGYLRYLNSGTVVDSVLLDDENLYINNDGTVSHLGDLREHIAHSSTPYVSVGGAVTDNGDGTITISEGEVFIKMTNDMDADFIAVTVPESTLTITANQNIILFVDYNSGTPVYSQMVSTPGYFYSNWDVLPFATVVNIGTKIIINDFKDAATNGIFKNILSQLNYQPIRYLGGLSTSETGTRQLSVTAGALLIGNDYSSVSAVNTSTGSTFTRMYVTAGSWTRTTGQTTVSNTQYNNVSTGLVSISNNKYANKWLYYVYDSPSFWVLVEGQQEYTALSDAQSGSLPSQLPPELNPYYAGSILVAKIIVQQGTTNIVQVQNPLVTQFQVTSSGASTDHAILTNLAWSTSGHTGTASTIAAFDGTGATTNITPSSYPVSNFQDNGTYMDNATHNAAGLTTQYVGTTNIQTLTNKTLTTPTISDFTNATHGHTSNASGGTISYTNLTDKPWTVGTNTFYYATKPVVIGSSSDGLSTYGFSVLNPHNDNGFFLSSGSITDPSSDIIFRAHHTNLGQLLELDGDGNFYLTKYGDGSFTGTATYNLAVDANGQFIETSLSGGSGATQLSELSDVTTSTPTSGNLLIANGTVFNSTAMSGDVTINSSGVTAVANDSHTHNGTTISGLAVADFTSPNISNWTNDANYADKDLANTFSGDISVPDESYGVGWNGSLEVPTKNAVYDKIQTLGGGGDMLLSNFDTDLDGDIDVTAGGTNLDSYTTGDLIYASGIFSLSKLGIGTNGYVLKSNGSAPYWAAESGGSGGWTDAGTSVNLTTSTDVIGIGSTGTSNRKINLSFNGDYGIYAAVTGGIASIYASATSGYAMQTSGDVLISGDITATRQLLTINDEGTQSTSPISIDTGLGDLHTVDLTGTGSMTLNCNQMDIGSQGTILLNVGSSVTDIVPQAWSGDGAGGTYTEIELNTLSIPSGGGYVTCTYTVFSSTEVTFVWGSEI